MNALAPAADPLAPSWLDRSLWPWAGRPLPTSQGRVHVTEVGSGPPVLFVHGTPTWSIDWRHVIADLQADHRCIALDHLGFGLSERPEHAGYRPQDHAARFSQVADALDLRDVTVVVHDFGGPVALPWVLDHLDRVQRLVVLNSFAWPLQARSERVAAAIAGSLVGRLLYRWLNASLRLLVPSAWADRSKLTPPLHQQLLAPFSRPADRERVLWALARALLASEPFYRQLESRLPALRDTPVDVIWGLADPTFGPAHKERWRALVPHARVLELDGVGHWPHEEAPTAVIDRVRSAAGRAS